MWILKTEDIKDPQRKEPHIHVFKTAYFLQNKT